MSRFKMMTKKYKKRKITPDDWTRPELPRPLTPCEQAIFHRGRNVGYDSGYARGLEDGAKKANADSLIRRVEVAARLVSSVGQSFDSIARVLHEDGVVASLLRVK